MYNIMIVDDEPIFSLAIKSISNWEENNINIAYEAENGRQALKILEEKDDIDIIITDLNMPVMDGIDFIKSIKNRGLKQKIVVISGYEDYDLVRKAFKLGVEDYLLKTEIDETNLLELLKKLINDVNENKSQIYIKSKEEKILLKESILKRLIDSTSTIELERSIIKNNINLCESNIISLFLWVDDYYEIEEKFKASGLKSFVELVKNTIKNVVDKEEYGEIVVLSPQEYVVIFSAKKCDIKYLRNKIENIINNIMGALFNYLNITVTIGVGSIVQDYANVSKSYKHSERNVRFRFLLGKNRAIFNSDISNLEIKDYKSILKKIDNFSEALKEGDKQKSIIELNEVFKAIKETKYNELNYIRLYYSDIVFSIINSIKGLNVEIEDVLGDDEKLYEKISEYETYSEMNRWISSMALKFIEYREKNKKTKYSYTIRRAIKYIEENYDDPNLSIKKVSSCVELSESYFSVLFSSEVGENFKDYIINLRVNKAKKLIEETNMKIYEICEEVGYRNVEHFSRIFKKVIGVSPNIFKKN